MAIRAVFTWLSKGIGFGFGFTTPFGWLVYLLWFWFYDSQVKTALLPIPFCFVLFASVFTVQPPLLGHLYSRDTAIQGTQNLVLEKCSGGSRVGAWGGHPTPPYFWTKLRPEGLKNIFLETGSSPLSKGLDDRSPPPSPLSLGLGLPLKCSHNLCICCLYWRDTSIQGKGTLILGPKTWI